MDNKKRTGIRRIMALGLIATLITAGISGCKVTSSTKNTGPGISIGESGEGNHSKYDDGSETSGEHSESSEGVEGGSQGG